MTLPILLLVAALSFALGAFASAQIACWSLKSREDKLAADRRRLNALRSGLSGRTQVREGHIEGD